jgi:hypothetical protein
MTHDHLKAFFYPRRPSDCSYLRSDRGRIYASHNSLTGDTTIFRHVNEKGEIECLGGINQVLAFYGRTLVNKGHRCMIIGATTNVFTGTFRLGRVDLVVTP